MALVIDQIGEFGPYTLETATNPEGKIEEFRLSKSNISLLFLRADDIGIMADALLLLKEKAQRHMN